MSDLPALAAVLREFPDVISIVDTVSSFSAVPIDKDALGLDIPGGYGKVPVGPIYVEGDEVVSPTGVRRRYPG